MDEFLHSHDLPKLNQEEIMNSNRSITSNEIGTGMKRKLKTKEGPGPSRYSTKYYQTFKRTETSAFEITP